MCVLADIERAIDALRAPVVANRLRDGEDMGGREAAVERRTSMSAGAELHELRRIADIGLALVELTFELRDVDEQVSRRRLPCVWMNLIHAGSVIEKARCSVDAGSGCLPLQSSTIRGSEQELEGSL